jgi:hypothetical protein
MEVIGAGNPTERFGLFQRMHQSRAPMAGKESTAK